MALVFTRLFPSHSAYSRASRLAYLPLCDYMSVFLRALNASHVDAPIPAYDSCFTRLCI